MSLPIDSAIISQLFIYPIKALCGVSVDQIEVSFSGLQYDRGWAMLDRLGRYINGKTNPKVHSIQLAHFSPPSVVTFECHSPLKNLAHSGPSSPASLQHTFDLDDAPQRQAAEEWLSKQLGVQSLRLTREGAPFADDPRFEGPSIVSLASLAQVQQLYSLHSLEEATARFRPNLVVDQCPAFWEDALLCHDPTLGISIRVSRSADHSAISSNHLPVSYTHLRAHET